jgi:hypothetical protein
MFIIKEITPKQASLLLTLNVSVSNNIKVNIIDLNYVLKNNNLYDMYVSVGITDDKAQTIIIEEQFKKNILSMDLPYQIKQSIVIGGFGVVITNIPGIYRRFITQAFESGITLETVFSGVGTSNEPAEQTIILLPENPFEVNRLENIILDTNYANFDNTSFINNESVLCLVEYQKKFF